jgi:hypothetical protein
MRGYSTPSGNVRANLLNRHAMDRGQMDKFAVDNGNGTDLRTAQVS